MAVVDQAKESFILATLKGMEYGSVVITIHDGTITQIDKTEKTRFGTKRVAPNEQKSFTKSDNTY
ncbi:YezD family protein [Neobacillus soli]|uniref:YezD family protein n=1 Tax=Neobacillus soli TaxID=220688 RepID=UPI0008241BDC|nr:YezD family protein [Neobacillus soli]